MYGGTEKFQSDPHWRDLVLFHEYFHGDNGAGIGASHQTGWTALVAPLMRLFGAVDAKAMLEGGKRAILRKRAEREESDERPAELPSGTHGEEGHPLH
jgi:hypothetical protein